MKSELFKPKDSFSKGLLCLEYVALMEANPKDVKLKKIQKKFERKKAWKVWKAKVTERKVELQEYEKNLFPNN